MDRETSTARPLIITKDPELLDDLVRLTAAAGQEADVFSDLGGAHRFWSGAPVVLVGADAARPCAQVAHPRRHDVILVSRDLDDAGVWQQAVALGADRVVFLPDGEAELVNLLVVATEGQSARGRVVGVVGGRGGAGASTLAAALAVTALRSGLATMLIDADPLGGGLDLLLGGEGAPGLRWPDLADSRGRIARGALNDELPRVDDLTLLSWGRDERLVIPPAAMRSVLDAGVRDRHLVVVDLPRWAGEAAQAALDVADVVVLIVPAEVRAAAAAARVATSVRPHCPDIRVVVRGPAPAGLDGRLLAEALDLPLAGRLQPEPGLAAAQERGEPPARRGTGPLARLCAVLLDELVTKRGASA